MPAIEGDAPDFEWGEIGGEPPVLWGGKEIEISPLQDERIRAIFDESVKEELSFWEKIKRACEEAVWRASEREKSGKPLSESERQFREFLFPKQKEIDANFAAFGAFLEERFKQLKQYGIEAKGLSEDKIRELLKGSSKRLDTLGDPNKDFLIVAINGVNTPLEEALSHQAYLRSLTENRAAIDFVYNASYHVALDLIEVFTLNYPGYSPNTAELLCQCWQEFAKNHPDDPNRKILVPCHSQGAIHVYNGLLISPPEIRNRIIVAAIAPAKVVPSSLCCKSFNYASKKDIVHYGELLKISASDPNDPSFFSDLERLLTERAELTLLDPHPNAIGLDHDFQSPTFRGVLTELLNKYLQSSC